MILISHKGEHQLVHSLDGYPGCKVVEKGVGRPPHEHCKRVKGKWIEDKTAKAAAEEEARLRAMSFVEFLNEANARCRQTGGG